MFRSKSAWRALALLVGLFMPASALALEMDPYVYKIFVGRVYLEYETRETKQGQVTTDLSRFKQIYSLDTKGNFLNRRLVIYDAGVSWTGDGTESNSSSSDTSTLDFYGKTTILPKSAIPLTLYAQYTDTETTGNTTSQQTRTMFGLNWFSRIPRLPRTGVAYERVNTSGTNVDTTTNAFKLDMQKEIGPTDNTLYYSLDTTENNLTGTPGTASSTLNLTNKTDISSYTQLYLGATRSVVETPPSPDTNLYAFNASLTSNPGREFSQTHNYTYFQNNSSSKQSGSNYSGDLSYQFNERLLSKLSLTVNQTSNESDTATTDTTSIGANAALDYALSREFSISETLFYSESSTNSSDPQTNNLTDYGQFKEQTTLNYRTNFTWANLGARYSLGYTQEQTLGKQGAGIEQAESISLSNINFNRFVTFNLSAARSDVKRLSGDISGQRENYFASAANKFWKKYVSLNAKYEKNSSSSWISSLQNKDETLRFDAVSEYFEKTKISYNAEHRNIYDSYLGFSSNFNSNAFINHNRRLLGGALDLMASYGYSESKHGGETQKVNSKQYNIKYARGLLRGIFWRAMYDVTDVREKEAFTKTTTLENSLFWQLRHWSLSAEHRYILTDSTNIDTEETRLLFKATRNWTRVF